jgi:hypothetical protein
MSPLRGAGSPSARRGIAAAFLALALPGAALAEMYRCQGPDGKTLFTSDRSQCPGAARHETSGQLQRPGGAPEPARARPPAKPRARAVHDEAEAGAWRGRRASAEAELAEARARLASLHEIAGWCNRGHEVWATDADGLRHGVDCDDIDATQKALRREEKRLEAYLEEGLEEECRRAGCLPGWIR